MYSTVHAVTDDPERDGSGDRRSHMVLRRPAVLQQIRWVIFKPRRNPLHWESAFSTAVSDNAVRSALSQQELSYLFQYSILVHPILIPSLRPRGQSTLISLRKLAWSKGWQPSGADLHSSREPTELTQFLWCRHRKHCPGITEVIMSRNVHTVNQVV